MLQRSSFCFIRVSIPLCIVAVSQGRWRLRPKLHLMSNYFQCMVSAWPDVAQYSWSQFWNGASRGIRSATQWHPSLKSFGRPKIQATGPIQQSMRCHTSQLLHRRLETLHFKPWWIIRLETSRLLHGLSQATEWILALPSRIEMPHQHHLQG